MRNIVIAVSVLGLVVLGCSKKSQSGWRRRNDWTKP